MEKSKNPKYRPDIDGLRAIAILLVIGFHATPGLIPGGFVGVDIFFVISGFLITGLLLEDLEKREFSFAGFYARRIRRIFSALVVVLLVCLVAGWLLLPRQLFGLEYIWGRGLFGQFSCCSMRPAISIWRLRRNRSFTSGCSGRRAILYHMANSAVVRVFPQDQRHCPRCRPPDRVACLEHKRGLRSR